MLGQKGFVKIFKLPKTETSFRLPSGNFLPTKPMHLLFLRITPPVEATYKVLDVVAKGSR